MSPPSSPVEQVYLYGNYIYNDVRPAAGMRSGGPLMNGGGQQSANGGGQSDKTTGKDTEQVYL